MVPFDYTIDERLEIIKKYVDHPDDQIIYAHWFDVTTADAWRHNRMYEIADCLKHLDYRWLTVGDGRFGLDSLRLENRGIKNVTPTDITKDLLDAAKKEGWIKDYSVENAEKLSFSDNAFDVVFCKEAYHHFPHPQIGLYEMLRIAREMVILVEPNDKALNNSLHSILSQKKLISHARYETIGNYVYPISRREIVKIAIVTNMKAVAFKGINDCYKKGLEFESADVKQSKLFRQIRRQITLRNVLSSLHLLDYNISMAAMFKNPVDDKTLNLLKKNNWAVINLPVNPYI